MTSSGSLAISSPHPGDSSITWPTSAIPVPMSPSWAAPRPAQKRSSTDWGASAAASR